MPTLTKRSLIRFGENGLVLTVPKAWVDYYQLRAGDRLDVIADGELIIKPVKKAMLTEHGNPRDE